MLTIESARSWYRPNDPVHGFDHVLRVYRLAERIGQAEGADLEIVRAAVLLHDCTQLSSLRTEPTESGGSPEGLDLQSRQNHHFSGAEFAGQVLKMAGWEQGRIEAVQHCIRAHRFRDDREAPQTLEAQIVFDADKLDAIGAIGAARAIAYAVKAGHPVYAEPSELFRSTGQCEPGESHSSFHEYLFKLQHIRDRLYTPSARQIAQERHRFLAEFYERLGLEIDGKM